MATRPCFIGSVGDSTMLMAIDGISGHTSFIEMPHVNDIDRVQAHDDPSKVWVRFYGNGATTTEYIGDGQLGADLAPADPSSSPPRVYDQVWESPPLSSISYRIGRDAYLRTVLDNDRYLNNVGSGWELRNGANAVLYTQAADQVHSQFIADSQFVDFGPMGTWDVAQFVYAEILYTSIDATAGAYFLYGSFIHNNQLCRIRRQMNQVSSQFHYLLLRYNFTGGNTVTFDSFVDLGEATVDISSGSNTVIVPTWPSNKILIQSSLSNVVEFDPVGLTLTDTGLSLGDYINDTNMFYNWQYVNVVLSDPRSPKFMEQLGFDGASYHALRTQGVRFYSLNPDLTMTNMYTPPFSELPVVAPEDVTGWGRNFTTLEKSSKFLVSVDYVTTNMGTTQISKAKIFDADSAIYATPAVSTTYSAGVAPQSEVELDDMAETQLQAYAVTGFIRHEGVGVSTQVVLIDNASDVVVGRQMSNPTTGEYYFRCWTSGSKSILARHPTTGNFRVIHDVIPTPVG